jgi:hypothetical protein
VLSPKPIEDVAATMFGLLGLDPETEVQDYLNRPIAITRGHMIQGVLA